MHDMIQVMFKNQQQHFLLRLRRFIIHPEIYSYMKKNVEWIRRVSLPEKPRKKIHSHNFLLFFLSFFSFIRIIAMKLLAVHIHACIEASSSLTHTHKPHRDRKENSFIPSAKECFFIPFSLFFFGGWEKANPAPLSISFPLCFPLNPQSWMTFPFHQWKCNFQQLPNQGDVLWEYFFFIFFPGRKSAIDVFYCG